jgi:hypothetical protein
VHTDDMSTTEAPTATNCPRVMVGTGQQVHLRSNVYTDIIMCGSLRRGSWVTEVPATTEVTCAKCASVLARLLAKAGQ